jgi:hypothetical protein
MNRRTHLTTSFVIAAVLAKLAVAPTASAQPALLHGGRSLAGAWLIDATPAQPIVPPFKMLMTFHADETLVETQNDLLAPPFFATTGHGVWERTGRHTYSFTMVQLLFDPNFTGTLVGTLKTRASVTLDKANSLSGYAEVEITDTQGNVLFTGDGALEGTRIVSQPLP